MTFFFPVTIVVNYIELFEGDEGGEEIQMMCIYEGGEYKLITQNETEDKATEFNLHLRGKVFVYIEFCILVGSVFSCNWPAVS